MTYSLRVKKKCRTLGERIEGMQNDSLAEDECCVFDYGYRHSPSFWGKDTPQDLFVCLVDDCVVVDSKKIMSMDLSSVHMSGSGEYAIESVVEIPVGSFITFVDGWVGVNG